jgi:predicted GNAT superfamily acetyltransferase
MSPELLLALSHAGNPVLGAFVEGVMVGASVAVAGVRDDGTVVLHSHMTGVLTAAQHMGVGRRLKQAQRRWAEARSISRIEWTFDPLVRRNGWFNLAVLGATAPEYLVNFYGRIADGINGDDETDRLVAVWRFDATWAPEPCRADDVLVPTPPDIVALRRTDPDEARRWRLETRRMLAPRMSDGWTVVGMTDQGEYLLRSHGSHTGVA